MPAWLRWRMRRAGFHLLQKVASRAGRGPTALARTGERLGDLHFRLGGTKRRQLLEQIAWVLDRPQGDPLVYQTLKTAYQVNDRAILEVIALYDGAVPPERLAATVRVQGLEPVQAALAGRRGVILLGMHMGNGIAFAAHLAAQGLPVSAVFRESRKMPPGFFKRIFEGTGIEPISARSAVASFRAMAKALRAGRLVYVSMDQASKRSGTPIPFLGKQVPMPMGPAELARRTRAPVFPVLTLAATPEWAFQVGDPIRLCEGGPVEADLAKMVAVMDRHIRAYPHLWSWHQRRWWRYPVPHTD